MCFCNFRATKVTALLLPRKVSIGILKRSCKEPKDDEILEEKYLSAFEKEVGSPFSASYPVKR